MAPSPTRITPRSENKESHFVVRAVTKQEVVPDISQHSIDAAATRIQDIARRRQAKNEAAKFATFVCLTPQKVLHVSNKSTQDISHNALGQTAEESEPNLPTADSSPRYKFEEIKTVFKAFDHDKSGDLDTFELSEAITALWGRTPTTGEISSIIYGAGAQETNKLSLDKFSAAINQKWETGVILNTLVDQYEVSFEQISLGFTVLLDETQQQILVKQIYDQAIEKLITPGDAVVCVNGAPLGAVKQTKTLAQKVRPLKRPVKIMFERPQRTGSSCPPPDQPLRPGGYLCAYSILA